LVIKDFQDIFSVVSGCHFVLGDIIIKIARTPKIVFLFKIPYSYDRGAGSIADFCNNNCYLYIYSKSKKVSHIFILYVLFILFWIVNLSLWDYVKITYLISWYSSKHVE
jgi:hypothetical protein